jgi:pimeloyl-ACP methyl ester carboxylesterase
MPLIETATATFFFADHRSDDSLYPPIVLVHGAGGSHLDWPVQLRRLPEANLIAVDLPGHGKSPGPERKQVADYAGDIAALLDALGWAKAIITGHSMGGAIAQTMALDHADRVAGIILVGSGAKLGVHPDILEKALTDMESVARLLKDWMWGEGVDDSMRDLGYQRLLETPAAVTHGDYFACNNFDIRSRLAEINAPTLVIGGRADRMTPHKFAAYLQEHIANARLVTVEGGGHMMALEQPGVVTGAIQDWLKTL